MVQEIKFNLGKEDIKKEPAITLVKRIYSQDVDLMNTRHEIDDYDYYSVVERDGFGGIVICWDEGDTLEYVVPFIAEFED